MNERYKCSVCGWTPAANEPDYEWEHCPNCLSSIHNEDEMGFECGGVLEPISIWVKPNGQWEIIQRCRACGEMKNSPMSEDDSPIKILAVASRPLSSPPFPVERMEELTKIMGGRGDVGGYYLEQRKQEAKI
mgnify:CR=1 FL=1